MCLVVVHYNKYEMMNCLALEIDFLVFFSKSCKWKVVAQNNLNGVVHSSLRSVDGLMSLTIAKTITDIICACQFLNVINIQNLERCQNIDDDISQIVARP